jgi:HPt (histidine-containing phosphotransfer) domain-containing protein
MMTLAKGSQELTREAHTLKGTSGVIGLTRISQIAAEVEDGVRSGAGVEPLVMELKKAIAATRDELRRAGLLAN